MKKIFFLAALLFSGMTMMAQQNLWSGTMDAGNWANYQEIAADQLNELQAGDVLCVSISTIDKVNYEWPAVYCYPIGDWEHSFCEQQLGDLEAPLVVRFTLTAEQVNIMQTSGFMVRGCGFVMTSVDIESSTPVSEVELWSGTLDAGNWANYQEIAADQLSGVQAGDVLSISISTIDKVNYEWPGVFCYPIGDWEHSFCEQQLRDLEAPLVVRFTLTAEQVNIMQTNGFMLRGCGFIMTRVAIEKKGEATAIDMPEATMDNRRYDIQGRMVGDDYHGIVIVGGKKVLQ